jgi:hypothetical protein
MSDYSYYEEDDRAPLEQESQQHPTPTYNTRDGHSYQSSFRRDDQVHYHHHHQRNPTQTHGRGRRRGRQYEGSKTKKTYGSDRRSVHKFERFCVDDIPHEQVYYRSGKTPCNCLAPKGWVKGSITHKFSKYKKYASVDPLFVLGKNIQLYSWENPRIGDYIEKNIGKQDVYSEKSESILDKFKSFIGFDAEFPVDYHRTVSNMQLATLQIAFRNGHVLIVTANETRPPHESIKSLFMDPEVLKIGFAIAQDMVVINEAFDINPNATSDSTTPNVPTYIDLQMSIPADSDNNQIGLAEACFRICKLDMTRDISTDKANPTLSYWQSKRLCSCQIQYAARDAVATLQIAQLMFPSERPK